jgi:hypothetical protein
MKGLGETRGKTAACLGEVGLSPAEEPGRKDQIMKHVSCALALIVLAAFAVDASDWAPFSPDGSLDIAYKDLKAAKGEPAFPGLDAGLNRIAFDEDPLILADSLGYRTRDDRVQIVAVTDAEEMDELKTWLKDRDATFVSSAGDLVQAFVPVSLLTELEDDSRVLFVRKPSYIQAPREPETSGGPKALAGSYTSEGVAAMNANEWHAAGYRGQGTKIGIVAFGYYGYGALLGTELPPAAKVHYRSFSGSQSGNSFGVADAEIIHDVAPDAELYLAEVLTAIDSVNALAWMQSSGVDVIVSDLYLFPESPGDGTGVFAQIASGLVSSGIIPVAGSGNFRMTHWQGRWSDPDSDGLLNFEGDYVVNFMTDGHDYLYSPPGISLVGAMVWNEWNSPTTDLDFCAVVDYDDGAGVQILECAEDVQDGSPGQLPREISEFTTPAWGYYGFIIGKYSGSGSPDIEVFLYREDAIPEYRVADGSLVEPADSQDVIAVGAVDAISYSLQPYSSRGPTNGAGGSISGGRTKPDLAGYSMVSTYTYGTRALWGTSPAAMHVAGAAALVWSANPGWSNTQVRTFLESKAVDRGPSGKDNDYGYGRLYLGSPDVAPPPSGACNQDLNNGVVCLRDGRFEFIGTWSDFANPPNTKPLIWTPVQNINATAGFQNNPSGIQVVMRVADGCSISGTWWVWLGGFTDAGWDISVRDTVTGKQTAFTRTRQGGSFPTTTRDMTTFSCN